MPVPSAARAPRSRLARVLVMTALGIAGLLALAAANGIACDKIPSLMGSTDVSVQVRSAGTMLVEGKLCFATGNCEAAVLLHGLLPADVGRTISARAAREAGRPLWLCLRSEGGANSAGATQLPPNVRTCVADVVDSAGARHAAQCDSACAWLWMAGSQRELFGESRVGFHRPYLRDTAICEPGNYFAAAEGFARSWIREHLSGTYDRSLAVARSQLRWAGMWKGAGEAFYVDRTRASELGLQPAVGRGATFFAAGAVAAKEQKPRP